jgi:hypothetical protein
MMRVAFVAVFLVLVGCAGGGLTVVQRSGGLVLPATYDDGFGETQVTVTMDSGEVLKGRLTWIPPGGGISSTLITVNNVSGTATGMSTGNKGMYIGTLVGNKGTTMRVELLCNAFTGKCVGLGQSNSGEIFDIQR